MDKILEIGRKRKSRTRVTVITGSGNHSQRSRGSVRHRTNNISTIRRYIQNRLQRENCPYTINGAYLTFTCQKQRFTRYLFYVFLSRLFVIQRSVGENENYICFSTSFTVCLPEFSLRSLDSWQEVAAPCLNRCITHSFRLFTRVRPQRQNVVFGMMKRNHNLLRFAEFGDAASINTLSKMNRMKALSRIGV